MTEKLSITLPTNMVNTIKNKVRTGDYASTSEVLRAAMRTWMKKEEEHEAHLDAIRQRVKYSLDDERESLSSEQMKERMDNLFNSHQSAK